MLRIKLYVTLNRDDARTYWPDPMRDRNKFVFWCICFYNVHKSI